MAWNEAFLRYFGPGVLGGITLGNWFRLLCDNRFAVSPSRLLRAAAITGQSVQNSLFSGYERLRFGSQVDATDVEAPVFLLGHWRSGTTHLHNLFAVDDRFAFPNNYQVLFPHSFLSMEGWHARFVQLFLPRQRPMDNVEWTMQSPQEDEFALCITSLMSPCMSLVFPDRREYYDRYLTLRNVTQQEVARWQGALLAFLKRLTFKLKKPLILKSPPHTCRIRRLLEVFPNAKFIHIHRDPFAVFLSTRKMLKVGFDLHALQEPRLEELDGWILRQYRTMYEAFFEERSLIPEGNFHEVCFEKLEVDPVGELAAAYRALGLPAFDAVRSSVTQYARSLDGYQKNCFPELSEPLRKQIADEWRQSFEEWGYPTHPQAAAEHARDTRGSDRADGLLAEKPLAGQLAD